MGRSRGKPRKNKDRAKRSRAQTRAQNRANNESTLADNKYMTDLGLEPGQETSNGKTASYHCDYCNKDITGMIRLKCAVCPDFDLCIECFTVGAEVNPHKSDHAYRVMSGVAIHPVSHDWTDEEELLLLEAIDIFGFNWDKIAEHVETKGKDICINHYTHYYINSPFFPLPDMSHADAENRVEIVDVEHVENMNDGPSSLETSGGIPKRRELIVEYNTDAAHLLKRIRQLEVAEHLEQKRRSEADENSRLSSYSVVETSSSQNAGMDLTRYPETALLSESEKGVCCELRLPPALYMRMQQVMLGQILQGTITKRSDAHQVFSMATNKIDRLYDMLVEKGIAPPP